MVLNVNPVLERVRSSLQESVTPAGRKAGFKAMGTWCQMTFQAPSKTAGDFFVQEAVRWVAEFEARYSRFIPESLIGQINQEAGKDWVQIDAETERIMALCHELVFFTQGVFDPTALPLIKLWDWKTGRIPSDSDLGEARGRVGWTKVQRKPGAIRLSRPGMSLDLGGIGKEYAVDRVIQLAQEHGITGALVDFGQDIYALGAPPGKPAWHIGLEDPQHPGKCWTGLAAVNLAVATSGDYLRNFQAQGRRYGHIIDPRTGYPVDNACRAVTVVAPTCTFAGILSTSAFILGPVEGLNLIARYMGGEGCILTDHKHYQTRRFNEYVTH